VACPLCADPLAGPSWLGSSRFEGQIYTYVECRGCASLFLDPMPDPAMVGQMYGPEYRIVPSDATPVERGDAVGTWLMRGEPGVFLDYGCGSGEMLQSAAVRGWTPVGVELDSRVAEATAARTGARVVTDQRLLPEGLADVLHLGDVIEHLTRIGDQMPEILRLLKAGGVLLAQGPLEANANLFTAVVRLARTARRRPIIDMAPYHVLLATAAGQRELFRRFGLEELQFDLSEVAWPAPARLVRGQTGLREVGLFALRSASRAVSALRPRRWGNRYFYAGRRQDHAASPSRK